MGQYHQQSLPHHCHSLDHFGQGMPLRQYQLVCPKTLCHQLHLQQKPQQVNQDTVEHRYISHFSIFESLKHGNTNLRYNSQQYLLSYCNYIEPKPNYVYTQIIGSKSAISCIKKLPRTKQLTLHSMQQYQKTHRFSQQYSQNYTLHTCISYLCTTHMAITCNQKIVGHVGCITFGHP